MFEIFIGFRIITKREGRGRGRGRRRRRRRCVVWLKENNGTFMMHACPSQLLKSLASCLSSCLADCAASLAFCWKIFLGETINSQVTTNTVGEVLEDRLKSQWNLMMLNDAAGWKSWTFSGDESILVNTRMVDKLVSSCFEFQAAGCRKKLFTFILAKSSKSHIFESVRVVPILQRTIAQTSGCIAQNYP